MSVDGEIVGAIGRGLLVLLGVHGDDTERDLRYTAEKALGLRIFPDDAGRMNRSLLDLASSAAEGEGGAGRAGEGCGMLVVSQFTLYGDCRKGRRPSFVAAAEPSRAEAAYVEWMDLVRELSEGAVKVERGTFGAHMDVRLLNDGPVTLIIDSSKTI